MKILCSYLLFLFLIPLQLPAQQLRLQRENDSLRLEIRLQELQHQNNITTSNLNTRLEQQEKLISNFESQISNWVGFTEVFFGVVGVILALFAFFGYRQIKQYGDIAKRDQQEIEKIVLISKEQQNAIKKRHDELQQFKPEEVLTKQNKDVINETISEAKKQLAKSGFDALKNLYQAKAISAYDKKDWLATLRYSETFLDFDDTNVSMWHKWSRAKSETGDNKKAIEGYTKAIQINNNGAYLYNNRSVVYERLNLIEEAIKDATHAINLDPKYELAYMNRALYYHKVSKKEEAIKDYEKVLKLNPNGKSAYLDRTETNYRSGNYKSALEGYLTLCELEPSQATNYFSSYLCYQKLGNLGSAKENLQKALNLDPNNTKYKELLKEMNA